MTSVSGLSRLSLLLCWLACVAIPATAADTAEDTPPNVIIMFADDSGYADLGCFGAEGYETPHLDSLARDGVKLTSFYVAQPVCSASRVALLTGCYPNRLGIVGALGPAATHGIHDDETTLGELFRSREYATACFGKWHLGHHPQFLPRQHGFDEYYGLPYSNDMWPKHPTAGDRFPDLPLIEGEKILEYNPDQTKLTTDYTTRAVRFIERNKAQPFFLYLAHSMPHVPLFVSDKHAGTTRRGLYGDVISEIDWSMGEILKALDKHQLAENTLVIFTSDNGPWLLYGNHAGVAKPLREGKATTFDGGVRVPFVARWPGKIPAGTVSSEPVMSIDILPTLAGLIHAELPKRPIDGLDIWPILSGKPGAKSPHDVLYFYWLHELQAVRSGKWKLHLGHKYTKPNPPGGDGLPGKYSTEVIGTELFDLEADIGETKNLADVHPDVVKKLTAYAEQAREDLGDSHEKRVGKNVREPGRIPTP